MTKHSAPGIDVDRSETRTESIVPAESYPQESVCRARRRGNPRPFPEVPIKIFLNSEL